MILLKYTYWQDDEMWLGYLEEYPDYMTQGETKEELQENIKDIYQELINGTIPSLTLKRQNHKNLLWLCLRSKLPRVINPLSPYI